MGELREIQLKGRAEWAMVVFLETAKDTTVRAHAPIFAKQIPKGFRTLTSAGFSFLMQNVSPSLLPV
jgi:hypothetical protein